MSEQLIDAMGEFDRACARVATGENLDEIPDESVREALMALCGIGNSARMAFAVVLNNYRVRTIKPGEISKEL